jgi:uroporphyrinogen-III decarboxylase
MKIGFSPSVYEHAAALIDRRPWDVSRNLDLLVAAHKTAYELYGHAPVVVGIDIYNLEAEAYGGTVREPMGNGIPAVVEPVVDSLGSLPELASLDPERSGRIPLMIEAGRRLKTALPEARVCVPVSGPFSIATSLRGGELLADVATHPDAVRAFLSSLVEGQAAFCSAIHEAGLGIALFESGAAPPLLSPAQFRDVALPPLKQLIAGVREVTGEALPCVIGGDTEPILDAILETGTQFVICPAETDKYAFMQRLGERGDITVRINLDPELVSRGSREAILAGVDEILELAAGRPNVLLGTGAVPYETPRENILLIRDYVA